MTFNILKGIFTKKEAIELLTQMVHIKIKYQETKISHSNDEKEVRMREARIRSLQKHLYEARELIENNKEAICLNGQINIYKP